MATLTKSQRAGLAVIAERHGAPAPLSLRDAANFAAKVLGIQRPSHDTGQINIIDQLLSEQLNRVVPVLAPFRPLTISPVMRAAHDRCTELTQYKSLG